MKQPSTATLASLLELATKTKAGATAHGVSLNLVVGTSLLIDADMTAVTTTRDSHLAARADLRGLRQVLASRVSATYDAVFGVRDILKRKLSKTYSPNWEGTGFDRSLAVPRSVGRLQNMAGALKGYFIAHPEMEVEDLATAELLDLALQALIAAHTAVTQGKATAGTLLRTRKQKERVLRKRIRGLVEELDRVLDPMDDRWTAFGLNKPGLKQKPPTPGKVTAMLVGNNALAVGWDPVPRAEYYRVWVKVKDQDEAFRPVGNSSDRNFTIEDLPSNTEVEVAISAVNNGGESAMSEVYKVTTA